MGSTVPPETLDLHRHSYTYTGFYFSPHLARDQYQTNGWNLDGQPEQFTKKLRTDKLQNPHIRLGVLMTIYQSKANHTKAQQVGGRSSGMAEVRE